MFKLGRIALGPRERVDLKDYVLARRPHDLSAVARAPRRRGDPFRRHYPQVRFRPELSLCFADPAGRIVTAGGTTSWHDLALHIISRHLSPGEAMRIAKVYLLKWHDEGQLR